MTNVCNFMFYLSSNVWHNQLKCYSFVLNLGDISGISGVLFQLNLVCILCGKTSAFADISLKLPPWSRQHWKCCISKEAWDCALVVLNLRQLFNSVLFLFTSQPMTPSCILLCYIGQWVKAVFSGGEFK